MSVKRLLVVSTEDSTKLRSWSNVPYLFCRNLELQEIELCRLTLKQSVVGSWFVRVLQGALRLLGGKSTTWTYSRASWYVRRAQGQIDASTFGLVGDMKSGQSNAITSANSNDDSDAGLNRAAFDAGTD